MGTRALLSAGIVGATMLVLGCSKSEPGETAPEQAARPAADTTTVGAGAAQDSVTAAQDSVTAAQDSVTAAEGAYPEAPDTSSVTPDTTGFGAGADSVRSDSM